MPKAPSARLSRALVFPLALALASSALADRIYLSDGSILEDVNVISEGISEVVYSPADSKKEEKVGSELVLAVKFDAMPEMISGAEIDAEGERFGAAVAGMDDYIANLDNRETKRNPWAAPYARFRKVQFFKLGADLEGMAAAVADVVATDAQTRYAPLALIEQIDALRANNDLDGARAAITALKAMVKAGSLSNRWDFEADVRRLLVDPTQKGEALEKELEKTAKLAATFPTVASLAKVARAQSMLQRSQFEEAEEVLRGVVADANGSDATLAAAWNALGDSLFEQAKATSITEDAEGRTQLLEDARLAFMRVVENYSYEYGEVAKAAYFAGRTFQEIGGPDSRDNAKLLFNFVRRKFRGTRWANDAAIADRAN